MKPAYSISELADVLNQDVYTVANGLVAADVPTFHNGERVNLAHYECFRPHYSGEGIFVVTGGKPSPNQNTIIVSTAALPDIWLQSIKKESETKGTASKNEEPLEDTGRDHVSDHLAILNQAAQKWWANASKDDRTTHSRKSDVVAWLMERGFSKKLADSAATIIRPEWVPTGRRPEE